MFFDILKVGALAAFSPLQTVLTVLILTRLVARFGTEALAGYGIGARLEFLLVPIVFAVGVASVPMVGMAIGAGDIARARRVAWTGACVSASCGRPDRADGRGCAAGVVRAASPAIPACAPPPTSICGWRARGSPSSGSASRSTSPRRARARCWDRCWPPPCGSLVIAVGGWLLAVSGAPVWTLFALVAVSMVAYGLTTAAAVYFTPWQARA